MTKKELNLIEERIKKLEKDITDKQNLLEDNHYKFIKIGFEGLYSQYEIGYKKGRITDKQNEINFLKSLINR